MPRPRCTLCQKPYGRKAIRMERIFVADGEPWPPPPYRGNAALIDERQSPTPQAYADGSRRVDCRDGPINAFVLAAGGGTRGRELQRTTWDGESYATPYGPFCTTRCAVNFAIAAHADGARYVLKEKESS